MVLAQVLVQEVTVVREAVATTIIREVHQPHQTVLEAQEALEAVTLAVAVVVLLP